RLSGVNGHGCPLTPVNFVRCPRTILSGVTGHGCPLTPVNFVRRHRTLLTGNTGLYWQIGVFGGVSTVWTKLSGGSSDRRAEPSAAGFRASPGRIGIVPHLHLGSGHPTDIPVGQLKAAPPENARPKIPLR